VRRYTLDLRGRAFVIDVQELGADRFTVIVGDERYDVTLSGDEDLPEAVITPGYHPAGAAPAAAVPVRRAVAAAAPASRPAAGGAGASLGAPMPGVILELHVKVGDVVKRGQQVALLDAMKMHNFIGAPRDGTIAEVCVAPGQAVGHGDAIVRFKEG
jgi:glutaconyl-CoA/methylmalonyl-CoA decarboxylase subunit gamma